MVGARSAEHYDWIGAANRRAHRSSLPTTVIINTVERAESDPENAALNEPLT
jgi:hypothetical protein